MFTVPHGHVSAHSVEFPGEAGGAVEDGVQRDADRSEPHPRAAEELLACGGAHRQSPRFFASDFKAAISVGDALQYLLFPLST